MHSGDVPQPALVISPGRGPRARSLLRASVGKGHLDLKRLKCHRVPVGSHCPTELLGSLPCSLNPLKSNRIIQGMIKMM